MKYLLTTTNEYGNEVEIAKFASPGDAYWTFSLFKKYRQTLRTLTVYKVSGKNRERMHHYENESTLVIKTVG